MKLLKKYINFVLYFFNIIYSSGETLTNYFLKENDFNKEIINKIIEKNKRTIGFIVLFALIYSFLFIDSILSFKFFFSITFIVFVLGVVYPFLNKVFINKKK